MNLKKFLIIKVYFSRILFFLLYPLNLMAIFLIYIYQNTLSMMWNNCCRFYPSCSRYASLCYKKFNFLFASYKVVIRLSKCHPYYNGECIDNI